MSRIWTISKLHTWEECGLRYALEYEPKLVIDRFKGWKLAELPERYESPQMARGTAIHDMFDQFLKTGKEVSSKHEHFNVFEAWRAYLETLYQQIHEDAVVGGTEILWAYDSEWYPIEGPSNIETWHRQKLDAWYVVRNGDGHHATIIDFKTGKRYEQKHADQMEVYALGAMARFDDVTHVTAALVYVDQPDDPSNPLTMEFSRDEHAKRLARSWNRRAERFQRDEAFAAQQGRHCGWCPYSQKKGGPCPARK